MKQVINWCSASLLLLLLAGCGTVPPAAKVMLSAPPEHTGHASHWHVMRIKMPEYLDNYDIRLRRHDYVMTHLDNAKWAERLPAAMTRTLQKTIDQRLESHRDRSLDVRVAVDNFELQSENEAVLSARWQVTDKDRNMLAQDQILVRKPVPVANDPDAVGKAMSEAVHELATDIMTVTERQLDNGGDP